MKRTHVAPEAALEETYFLGLRLTSGLNLTAVARQFGEKAVAASSEAMEELVAAGLVERQRDVIRLTPRGRLLSNEVFERFISSVENVG